MVQGGDPAGTDDLGRAEGGKWWQRRFPRRIHSLQDGFDRERTGLVIVQVLFAFVILFLVLALVVH